MYKRKTIRKFVLSLRDPSTILLVCYELKTRSFYGKNDVPFKIVSTVYSIHVSSIFRSLRYISLLIVRILLCFCSFVLLIHININTRDVSSFSHSAPFQEIYVRIHSPAVDPLLFFVNRKVQIKNNLNFFCR